MIDHTLPHHQDVGSPHPKHREWNLHQKKTPAKTNSFAPEKWMLLKETRFLSENHPFSGDNVLIFGRVPLVGRRSLEKWSCIDNTYIKYINKRNPKTKRIKCGTTYLKSESKSSQMLGMTYFFLPWYQRVHHPPVAFKFLRCLRIIGLKPRRSYTKSHSWHLALTN